MNRGIVISIAFALAFLLYFPVLGNGFLTDDYASLYRLLIQKRVLFEEMVRPLIDISFYCNYLISGLQPFGYYIFNLCVHALTCYMVYVVALDLPIFSSRRQEWFGLTACFLFLFYPFHNEAVVWLSGRLSSLAALFGLMAIHFVLKKKKPGNIVFAVICWWIGLFAYESILIVPGVILVLEWMIFRDKRRVAGTIVIWTAAGLLWLWMRHMAAGSWLPAYGQNGLAGDPVWLRFVKVAGRCFLPPVENARLMISLSAVAAVVVVTVLFVVWQRVRWSYAWLAIAFLLALLPAVAFEVSTRTTEGDRLLYFPSCILCISAAAVLMTLFPHRRWRLALCGVYAVVSVVFIVANNRRWVFASRTADSTLELIRRAPGRVVLVNVPDEWEGAFIFRNNFKEALIVNGIDTGRVAVTHFLTRLEYLRVADSIEPQPEHRSFFIYPATYVSPDSLLKGPAGYYYWNKHEWKPLISHHSEPQVR